MRVGDTVVARQGILFIISGPSGAGKTSVSRPVVEAVEGLSLSVSVTTRRARAGERDGVDYRFVSDEAFDRMVADGELAEWATVHGARYGTPRRAIDDAVGGGTDLLLDIDVQGAAQLRSSCPGSVSVFLLPPSREQLVNRLSGRRTDTEDTVRRRVATACEEIAELGAYDYAIVNDDLERTVADFIAIVTCERRRVRRLDAGSLAVALRSFDDETA